MEIRALSEEHRPGAGVWRTCSPLYTAFAAMSALAVVVLLNLLLVGSISYFFDLSFIVVCLGAGLLVRPGETWNVALLPPALLVLVVLFLASLGPATVASHGDSWIQAVITGVMGHSVALVTGWACFGVALWSGESATAADWETIDGHKAAEDHSNLDASPAPTRRTSG